MFDLRGSEENSTYTSEFILAGACVFTILSYSPGYRLLDPRFMTVKAATFSSFSVTSCYFFYYDIVLGPSFSLMVALGSFSIVVSLCSSTSGTWVRGTGTAVVFVFILVCMEESRSLSLIESSMLADAP